MVEYSDNDFESRVRNIKETGIYKVSDIGLKK